MTMVIMMMIVKPTAFSFTQVNSNNIAASSYVSMAVL